VKDMRDTKILGTSKIGTRGQVTIPQKARVEFSLKSGDVVLFIKEGEKLVIRRDL